MRQLYLELYKLRFNRSLFAMLLLNIVAQINFTRASSVEDVFIANINSNVVVFPCIYLSLLLISMDLSSRTINESICAGISRKKYFRTKVILYYNVAAAISIISTLTAQYIHGGFPSGMMLRDIVFTLSLRVILELGTLSIPFMVVFMLREQLWAIGLNAMYMMFCLLTMAGEIRPFSILFYFPVSMLTKLHIYAYYYTIPQLIIIPLTMLVVSTVISWLAFSRTSLK